ncbi:hypothetical protein [Streptomyces cyaneofuscatus]
MAALSSVLREGSSPGRRASSIDPKTGRDIESDFAYDIEVRDGLVT